MKYDKRLRRTIRKIMKLADREQFAAYVILVSQTHVEFRLQFPPWTCITITGDEVRFRSKKEDFDSDYMRHKITEDSVHAIMQIRDMCGVGLEFCERMIEKISNHMDITHESFKDFYSDSEDD